MHSGNLHRLIDCSRTAIECATEYIREADDVVDLVRIIATSCCHDDIVTRLHGKVVGNLRIRIGKGKHDGTRSHGEHHLGSDHISNAETEEYVGILHCLLQGVEITCGGELPLL